MRMRVYFRPTLTLVSLALGFAAGNASAIEFVDPLDVPATKTSLASRTPFNALARAGKRIVAVGQRGHILYSNDFGKNWTQADVPVSSDLTAVSFPSEQRGWAVGHHGVVLASTDGGMTWSRLLDGRGVGKILLQQSVDGVRTGRTADAAIRQTADIERLAQEGPDNPFLDVWFENDLEGYAIGAFNLILHTTNGGKTWESWFDRTENPKRLNLYAIRKVGGDLYLAGEQGLLLKLDRQAKRFRALETSYKGTFFGITGQPGTLLVYGLRGNVYRSTDKGARWSKVETGLQVGLTGADVAADGRIIIVSQSGHVIESHDDGASFALRAQKQPVPSSAVIADGKDDLLIAGMRGLHKLFPRQ